MARADDSAHPTALTRDADLAPPGETETATFGMGCFWGPEARFGAMDGVVRTRVGYAGGTEPDPSYYALGEHTEVVQLEYDSATLDYDDLLAVFWENHAWETRHKRQYRGVVLSDDPDKRTAAERSREALVDRTGHTVETAIEPLETVWPAEEYHQKHELRTVPAVVDELERVYGDAFVDSTVAARLNGFVAGYGTDEQRDRLLATLDFPPAAIDDLRRRFH